MKVCVNDLFILSNKLLLAFIIRFPQLPNLGIYGPYILPLFIDKNSQNLRTILLVPQCCQKECLTDLKIIVPSSPRNAHPLYSAFSAQFSANLPCKNSVTSFQTGCYAVLAWQRLFNLALTLSDMCSISLSQSTCAIFAW